MHNPRGSNDRLNGGNTNRQNAQRMFNSQNNAKGGYAINVGSEMMKYYEGSWLTVEWTNQHACGNENTDCTIILQYMCGPDDAPAESLIRDGASTDQITEDNYKETDGGKRYKYGLNEPLDWFQKCEARERNKGLFIADRNLNGDNAQYTRQNNGGTRYAFECQEEKDYYPYWHPTPWKDIAVFTDDKDRCSWYQEQSQNGMDKGHCEPTSSSADLKTKKAAWELNNNKACTDAGHRWLEDGEWDMPAPDCLKAPWSRDNHLGNGITDVMSGHMNHYNWTLPTSRYEDCIDQDNCVCVLRLRYNISTSDYQMFGDEGGEGSFVDHTFNGKGEKAVILQDPTLKVGGMHLSHALNTNQIARTFQDRSHAFKIRKRPAGVSDTARILNLNVRGKRGNIVQTYPAVEYDFVPARLVAREGDYIHVQWRGFDNNPNNGNNNAEGTQGTDRHNICQLKDAAANHCMCDSEACYADSDVDKLFESAYHRQLFAYAGQDLESDCDSYEVLKARHNNNQNNINEDKRNCMKMNAAKDYFDGGLIKLNTTGEFHYMSSRNNNFSNRSHKASITVLPLLSAWAIAMIAIGSVLAIAALVSAAMVVQARKNPSVSYASMFDKI